MRLLPFLLAFLLGFTRAQQEACPDAAALSPCTCDEAGINCMNVKSASQLQAAFRASGQNEHQGVWIQKTPIGNIHNGVFGRYKFVEAYIELNENLTEFVIESLGGSRNTLSTLSLFGNALDTFPFEKVSEYPELRTLNLAKNRLTSIPPRAFRARGLKKLALSYNPLTSVGRYAFAELPKLEMLHMTHTRLTTLGPDSFNWVSHSLNLKIFLSENRISYIDDSAFGDSAPLVLSLAQNNLTSLSEAVFVRLARNMLKAATLRASHTVGSVFTAGNPFSCQGCDYLWMVQLMPNQIVRRMFFDFSCSDGSKAIDIIYSDIGCNPDSVNP